MTRYTAVTFAPVQGFIQKSRKLRDLDGSSLILSFLAASICEYYHQSDSIVIPAKIDLTRGVPNQIIIKGEIPEADIRALFNKAWTAIVKTCQRYIEDRLRNSPNSSNISFDWKCEWNNCCNHSWELFCASGADFNAAKAAMATRKQSRNWVGINWTGESSSLSGADAIAWNRMCSFNPTNSIPRTEIDDFYKKLSKALPGTIIDERERLSIPELIKRLITTDDVRRCLKANASDLPDIEHLETFKKLNRLDRDDLDKPDEAKASRWTGWFMGDGDRVGKYLDWLRTNAISTGNDPDRKINQFSEQMSQWSADLKSELPSNNLAVLPKKDGRIVYAGGDDFLGVLYRNAPDPDLQLSECFDNFWYKFPQIWEKHDQKKMTVSVGFVWAAPRIPQRDLLQHCRLAEKSAKSAGRDRLAIRILFNNGNYLEWCCPWWCLEKILRSYRDRERGKNWTHFYNDIAALNSRRSIDSTNNEVAIAMFEIYFGADIWKEISQHLWNQEVAKGVNYFDRDESIQVGILGEQPEDPTTGIDRLNDWIVALSQVGFQIFANWS
jgi:CRISPR-associated protein Cmr2